MSVCVCVFERVSLYPCLYLQKMKKGIIRLFFSYVSVKTKCMYKYKMALFERLVLIFLQDYKTFQEFGFVNTVHTTKIYLDTMYVESHDVFPCNFGGKKKFQCYLIDKVFS